MASDPQKIIDTMMRRQRQHYATYDFGILLERVGYYLNSIIVKKENRLIGDKFYDIPVAHIQAEDRITGAVSYLKLYPRYLAEEFKESVLGPYERIDVRFSIKRDGCSFYTPCWESLQKNGLSIVASGTRIDWDKYLLPNLDHGLSTNPSIRKKYEEQFNQATDSSEGFLNALVSFLKRWLLYNTLYHDD